MLPINPIPINPRSHRRSDGPSRAPVPSLWGLSVLSLLLFLFLFSPPGPGEATAQPVVLGPVFIKSLVAYWPLNEGAGGEAQDASARGHIGQLRNGPEWAAGRAGYALRFDGLDDYVWVPYHPDWDLPQGFSLVLWAYLESEPDTTPGNDWRLLVGRSGFRPYGLALEQNGKLTGSVYVGGERRSLSSGEPLPVGEWAHLAFTYDAASGTLRLYRDGELRAEEEGSPGPVERREGRALTISLPRPEGLEDERAWPGLLDEILLFDRPLLPEEVRALYRGKAYN